MSTGQKPPEPPTLTRRELTIMKIVWQHDQVTVRDVYEALRTRRRIAYTTVMTMMNILEHKGFLVKARDGRAYRYRARRAETTVVRSMVREFVDRVFDGASHPLLVHLVEQDRLSTGNRAELLRLIEEADEESRGNSRRASSDPSEGTPNPKEST